MNDTIFQLSEDDTITAAAEASFERFCQRWKPILPKSCDIQHIGATAIPGCLTKGDIDICIRTVIEDFDTARQQLSAHFQWNSGSVTTPEFISFHDDSARPPLGIQLVVRGSELDIFVLFRDKLRADPSLVDRYNSLKQYWHGKSTEGYRSEKAIFAAEVISCQR